MEHDFDKALNIKLILCMFKKLSGLKINFHKSEIFCFVKARTWSINLGISSDVSPGLILLDTLVYQFISGN